MSGLYQKASLDLLYDLINKDNPDLPYKVSKDTFVVHAGPTVLTPTADAPYNTSVVMRGIQGAGYRGLITFRYNRIDLANLFKDTKVVLTHYTATTYEALRPLFNSLYGMALDASEWFTGSFSNNTNYTTWTSNSTLGIPSTTASLAFIGKIPVVQWNRGTPSLETMVSKQESTIPLLVIPTDPKHDFAAYYRGIDFTSIKAEIVAVYNTNNAGSWQSLAAALKNLTGDPWEYNNTGGRSWNIYGGSLSFGRTPAGDDPADVYYNDTNSMAVITLNTSYISNVLSAGRGGYQLFLPFNQ